MTDTDVQLVISAASIAVFAYGVFVGFMLAYARR